MTAEDVTRIDRSIEIKASPERVWRALTNAAELSAWFRVKIEGDIAAGQKVWMISVQPGEYLGMRFPVWFVELTPPVRVVWEWNPGAVDPKIDYSREPKTTVTFTLEPSPAGTRLTVSEKGFEQISLERRAKVFEDNSKGWIEVLVWLRVYAETAA